MNCSTLLLTLLALVCLESRRPAALLLAAAGCLASASHEEASPALAHPVACVLSCCSQYVEYDPTLSVTGGVGRLAAAPLTALLALAAAVFLASRQ